ncbi:Zinc finger protein 638 [Channa argus]|uniref:Zinc finger protein 638 n=1 Tax=Channa argus TaxID=215402 RepID=A0A6G1PA34_CHAAH|nr:Zinc finger protein 638 [Channa argus]
MYHHHSQQQGLQPFSNEPRPPHHQPPPNQHQNRPPSDMLSQGMGFQFPRPTQLPDELESALAIRGARDMDHRLIDHMNQSNHHQNQSSASGISQHGSYGSNPVPHASDHPPGHQQGVDWSNYQPPTKLFANLPTNSSHQSQQHQGPQQQQPQRSHAGESIPGWTATVSDSQPQQARHTRGGGGDGQGLYTPESAGSILASFGLSNEDLEVLSHYPDDQLTPDTLPFILRDIQINKSGNQKTVASTSSSSLSHGICELSLPSSQSSQEVPSLLTVTQTAGKVIDYGHASRAKDESSSRETFKREPLSSERTVKMYPASSSSSSAPKVDKAERRQVHLQHAETSKHGDRDYRRTSGNHRKNSRSSDREFPPSSKSRNLDRDYRRDRAKPRPPSESGSEDSSRHSLSSLSSSKPIGSSKKFPTPTMISDFSAVSPKVYPHTCSLCHIQCDQEKDWVDHINTVNHTAACRDLHNKYPEWKPNLSSQTRQYGNWGLRYPKDRSPSHSKSRSHSCSPPQSPHNKHRGWPNPHRAHGRPYSPQRHPRLHHYTEHRLEHHHSGSHSPSHPYQTISSVREHRPDRRDRESSGGSFHSGVKRPHENANRHPYSTKYGPHQPNSKAFKSSTKPGIKLARAKASDTDAKPPPAKKKKKVVTQASQDWSVADRLVYLTGIPKDASEQEVTDLVGYFGKINNVILMPCSEEEGDKSEGQKASVCMVKAEDTRALANATNLSIRDQQITASVAKKPEGGHSSDANSSKSVQGQDKGAAGEDSGGEADQKTSEEKGLVLITGLPDSGWSESDIIELIQPFGTPSDIIMAIQIGKVLVSVLDTETAQEIIKVHTFMPAKIKDKKVKMTHLKQCIGLNTPVALYNLLMASTDPFENSTPVGWSSLLVISNVPNTPSASSEVLKLVRRFGTVIKTLVLNNMVICKMATATMALSVYKRFQTFPCIIQNSPLFFSRKPDPKASTQTKVITAYLDAPEDTSANGKADPTAASAGVEESEFQSGEMEMDSDEKMKSKEKVVDENKALGENESKDELTSIVSDSATAPETKPARDLETNNNKASLVKTAMKKSDENKETGASEEGNDKSLAGEETKPCSTGGKAVSGDTDMPALPKVTQEMVKALLVECRTRIGSQPKYTGTVGTAAEQQETLTEKEQSKEALENTKEPTKNDSEEELKKQERERKERQARKEKEVKERERREEKRAWEKEERAKRERDERTRKERERKEELRREWERRERDRRERKRAYGEDFSGPRPSFRSQGAKYSSFRDEHHPKMEEEVEEEEEFPFNMDDFVTVDEVGDVTDLPSPPPIVSTQTTDDGEESPTSAQVDPSGDTPMEITAEITANTTETLVKSDEPVSKSEPVTLVLTTASETELPPQTETTIKATVGSNPDIEQLSTIAHATLDNPPEAVPEASSNTPLTGVETADSEEKKKEQDAASHSQAMEEMLQNEEDKDIGVLAAETGSTKESEDNAMKREESVKPKLQAETSLSTDYILPPFDPSKPVGMEFLVPKTGFFCKVCNRFFSGSKEAEMNHCKTVKHYENLQKHLQSMKTESAKADSC